MDKGHEADPQGGPSLTQGCKLEGSMEAGSAGQRQTGMPQPDSAGSLKPVGWRGWIGQVGPCSPAAEKK